MPHSVQCRTSCAAQHMVPSQLCCPESSAEPAVPPGVWCRSSCATRCPAQSHQCHVPAPAQPEHVHCQRVPARPVCGRRAVGTHRASQPSLCPTTDVLSPLVTTRAPPATASQCCHSCHVAHAGSPHTAYHTAQSERELNDIFIWISLQNWILKSGHLGYFSTSGHFYQCKYCLRLSSSHPPLVSSLLRSLRCSDLSAPVDISDSGGTCSDGTWILHSTPVLCGGRVGCCG